MSEAVLASPVRLVLFDLDGTLIDAVPQLYKAVNGALQELALPLVTLAQVSAWIGNGADMLLRRAWGRSATPPAWPDALAQRLRQAFDRHYHAGLDKDFSLFPGVITTLRQLRAAGLAMAVVTNKPHPFVAPLLQQAGLADCFDLVLGGDVLPQRKPDPAPLLHVCQQLGFSPAQSLMVGDSRNDILAAQAAGMRSVGLTYGYNHGEPIAACRPDWVFDQFCQLTPLLLATEKDLKSE